MLILNYFWDHKQVLILLNQKIPFSWKWFIWHPKCDTHNASGNKQTKTNPNYAFFWSQLQSVFSLSGLPWALNTTCLLTLFLIGLYYPIFTCLANYVTPLNMLHHKFAHETIFCLTSSLIGSINDMWFLLANQQVVLMGLIEHSVCCHVSHDRCNPCPDHNSNLIFISIFIWWMYAQFFLKGKVRISCLHYM